MPHLAYERSVFNRVTKLRGFNMVQKVGKYMQTTSKTIVFWSVKSDLQFSHSRTKQRTYNFVWCK